MTNRETDGAEKSLVAISPEMKELRDTQHLLNHFLWTSEMSYGYVLSEASTAFPNLKKPAVEMLGHVMTEAWYPSNQGRLKFDETIGKVLEQVQLNTVHIYRAVLIFFASAFENYLARRLGDLRVVGKQRGWGPYHQSLALPELLTPPAPLRLRTVLCADICRLIRNRMVHPPFSVPTSLHDPIVSEWKSSMKQNVSSSHWQNVNDSVIDNAFEWVIGHAAGKVKEAAESGKTLPVELFYTLFNFTNLDHVAFEIEEALIPPNTIPGGRASRKKAYVRRRDLVIKDSA